MARRTVSKKFGCLSDLLSDFKEVQKSTRVERTRQAHELLAQIHEAWGEDRQAMQEYRKAVQIESHPTTFDRLAHLLHRSGHMAQAVRSMRRALPDENDEAIRKERLDYIEQLKKELPQRGDAAASETSSE